MSAYFVKTTFSLAISGWFRCNVFHFPASKFFLNFFDPGNSKVKSGAFIRNPLTEKNKLADKQKEPKGICCINCHRVITYAKHASEIDGKHQHIVTNPNGITFNIKIYQQADCKTETAAVSDFSWFAGYQWRIVSCPGCSQHLGWSYHKNHSPDFYGLITDKLIDLGKL